MSCHDKQGLCNTRLQGQTVAGYASSTHWTGWGDYHYITTCPPFFTVSTIEEKLAELTKALNAGDTTKARDMNYLKTSGQFFLHELMHTRLAYGNEPKIIDEWVAPIPAGQFPTVKDKKAYGPRWVNKLAQRGISQGGDATRASTNADSYAMLANAIFWWDTTQYFPGIPDKPSPSSMNDDQDPDNNLVLLHLELENNTDLASANLTALFLDNLNGFGGGSFEDRS